MNYRNHLSHTSKRCGLTAAAALLLTGAAAAGPLLETHADSLTDYLPTTATSVQDVLPHDLQRVVNFDGTGRLGTGALGANINANPFGSAWGSSAMAGPINLGTGAITSMFGGMTLPATVTITIGSYYNAQQGGGTHVSDGYQGRNWVQTSQPELVLHEAVAGAGSSDDDDLLYIVFGNGRFAEFKRQDASSANAAYNAFKGVNGAGGVVEYAAGTGSNPDTYTLVDQSGMRFVFFGFDTNAGAAAGQLWKKIGTAGDVAYVGHETNPVTAISNGYDGSGRIQEAVDSSGRIFTYTYTNLGVAGTRLTRVVATDGSTTVGQVDYAYYEMLVAGKGNVGDLKSVTRTTPLNESGRNSVDETYFRYNTTGDMRLRLVVGPQGVWEADQLSGGVEAQSDAVLKPLSDWYFEYDGSGRVSSFFTAGSCGCSGAIDGTTDIFYEAANGFSASAGYDSEAKTYAEIVSPPQYAGDPPLIRKVFMDEVGQRGSEITYADPAYTSASRMGYSASTTPANYWITGVERDATRGTVTAVLPVDMTAIDTSANEFFTLPSTTGVRFRETVFNDGATHPELLGLPQGTITKATAGAGKAGATIVFSTDSTHFVRQITVSGATLTQPLRVVHTKHTGEETTTFQLSHDGQYGALRDKEVIVFQQAVTTANNGSNSPTVSSRHIRLDGTPAFTEHPDGRFDYTEIKDGLLRSTVRDASFSYAPAALDAVLLGFGLPLAGTTANLITTYTHDDQGRIRTTEGPTGRTSVVYRTDLDDDRSVTLSIPHFDGTNYHSPVSITLTNKRGQTVQSGTIAFAGGTTTADPSTWLNHAAADLQNTVTTGTLASLSEMVYDDGGRKVESRAYYDIAGGLSDETSYAYDDLGRPNRTVAPTGDISRPVRDVLGRTIAQWVGTDDTGFSPASGGGNMVKVSETEYDNGSTNGPGLVTKRTAHLDDSGTNTRVTEYVHDAANRLRVIQNPTAPHSAFGYDGYDRRTATGTYTSAATLTASTDPLTDATDRAGLTTQKYDSRGRVFETKNHAIDRATGAIIPGEEFTSHTWFDPNGRVAKTAGMSIAKTEFDSAGRVIKRSSLATDNDANYAESVGGVQADDVVVSESQSVYDAGGRVVMSVSIQRAHDAPVSGAGAVLGPLDSNADGDPATLTAADINGWASVSAVYHDGLDRTTDTVAFGTAGLDNGVASFARPATVPARSDTALRSTTEYDGAGRAFATIDPSERRTEFEHDDLGRVEKTIANYTDGTPGGGTQNDEDHTTTYAYNNGLKTGVNFWDGSGPRQATIYTYGVTKGTGPGQSAIASNSMLYSVRYPDSPTAGTSDEVRHAYNALGQLVWKQDQSGNVIETEYDSAGRQIRTSATTVATSEGYKSPVRRIEWTYNDLGETTSIAQFASTGTGGTPVDEVAYTYDDRGALASIEQDFNGAVLPGGDQHRIEYTYDFIGSASFGGVDGYVRRSQALGTETNPLLHGVTMDYGAAGSIDLWLKRVRAIDVDRLPVAEYDYRGMAQVVGTHLPEPDISNRRYDKATGDYHTHKDRFGRLTRDQWVRRVNPGGPIGTLWDNTIIDRTIAFSRTSAIDSIDHRLYSYDKAYTRDDHDQLRATDEGPLSDSFELDHFGNWDSSTRTVMGTTKVSGGTHNIANEMSALGSSTGITYNEVGQMTNDGTLKHTYDVFGRLVEISNLATSTVVSRYRYNGLGHRIAVQVGTGDWEYHLTNERWQVVAKSDAGSPAPKAPAPADFNEVTLYHAAGVGGTGSSSYIDSMILIEEDTTKTGRFDTRSYAVQNWRHDVVAMTEPDGDVKAYMDYTAYGEPVETMRADLDKDGDVDFGDFSIYTGQFGIADCAGSGVHGCAADFDRDGDVDGKDTNVFSAENGDTFAGRLGQLASDTKGRGYAGMQHDQAQPGEQIYYRNREYRPDLARLAQRDPMGYVDGPSMYGYARSMPVTHTDPMGLCTSPNKLALEGMALHTAGLSTRQALIKLLALGYPPELIAAFLGIPLAQVLAVQAAGTAAIASIPATVVAYQLVVINGQSVCIPDWLKPKKRKPRIPRKSHCDRLSRLVHRACDTHTGTTCKQRNQPCAAYAAAVDNINSCIKLRSLYLTTCRKDPKSAGGYETHVNAIATHIQRRARCCLNAAASGCAIPGCLGGLR